MRFARSCRHSLTRDPFVPTPKTTPKPTPTSTRKATQHTWEVRMHRCAQTRARARSITAARERRRFGTFEFACECAMLLE